MKIFNFALATCAVSISASSSAIAGTDFAPFPLVSSDSVTSSAGLYATETTASYESSYGYSVSVDSGYGADLSPPWTPEIEWPPSRSIVSMCAFILVPAGYVCIDTPNGYKIVAVYYPPQKPLVPGIWWDKTLTAKTVFGVSGY